MASTLAPTIAPDIVLSFEINSGIPTGLTWNAVIQAKLVEHRYGGSYPPVLAWTVVVVASLVAIVTWSGREKKGVDLSNTN